MQHASADTRSLKSSLAAIALGATVFALAVICLVFTRETGRGAAVWPGNAIVVAVLLRTARGAGLRYFLVALAGNLAADLVVGDSAITALRLSLCNSLEIALCVGIVRRLIPGDIDLGRPRDLAVFLLTAGVLAPFGGAISAVLALSLVRIAPFAPTLINWYAPDALGLLVITPALLALTPESVSALERNVRSRRGALSVAVIVVSLVVVFGQSNYPLLFLIPPALILVAFELNLAGTALALLVTAAVAVVMTLAGHGAVALLHKGLDAQLDLLQVFLAALTFAVLPVATALARRARLDEDLRASLAEVQAANAAAAEAYRIATLAQQVAGIGHWRRSRHQNRQEWSDQVFHMHGLTPQAVPPSVEEVREIYHPEDLPRIQEVVAQAFATGAPFELKMRFRRADNGAERTIVTKGEAERNAEGEVEAIVGVMRDITEEETARRRIEESDARFRLLAANANDVIACYGVDGVLTFVSPSVAAVLGYEPQDLIGKSTTSIMHPGDIRRVLRTFQDYVAAGPSAPPIRFGYRALRRDGAVIWVEAYPKAVYDATGAFVEFQDVIRDITAQVDLEAELRAARDAAEEAAAVKSEFMANMSHEIRTPLTAILGFTGLLAARSDLDEAARTQVERVAGAGQALLSIVNDVLDFSKLEAGQVEISPEPTQTVEMLRDAVLMFSPQAEAKGLSLVFEPARNLPPGLLLDPGRVRQILLNLIGNAVKFTEHGTIKVAASYVRSSGRLRVRVEDTGAGMSRAQQHKLFQRFSQVDASSTRRHGGTGLGLAICKGLAEAMGGDIGVRSRPGHGSVFHFQIAAPIVQPTADAPAAAQTSSGHLQGVRVLVVDDNSVNRELARLVLETLGAEVSEAEDGLTGVEAAARTAFDLVLLDIRMPGLGGPEALARIRAGDGPNRDIPILAFTADVDLERLPTRHGFDGLVRKPIVATDLFAAIHAALTAPPSEDSRNADAA